MSISIAVDSHSEWKCLKSKDPEEGEGKLVQCVLNDPTLPSRDGVSGLPKHPPLKFKSSVLYRSWSVKHFYLLASLSDFLAFLYDLLASLPNLLASLSNLLASPSELLVCPSDP